MDLKIFFDTVRDSVFRGRMSPGQVDGCIKIIDYRDEHWPGMIYPELAYVLATVYWESARTMQPIEEGHPLTGDRLRAYQRKLWYYPWFGRGLVQITHEENYVKFGITDKDDALKWDVSLRVLFEGMIYGRFRADARGPQKLSRYISARTQDWINARLIVNGIPKGKKLPDRAVEIAGFAKAFLVALTRAAAAGVPEKPIVERTMPTATTAGSTREVSFWQHIGNVLEKISQLPAEQEVAPRAQSPDLMAAVTRIEHRQAEMMSMIKSIHYEITITKIQPPTEGQ